ncbi:hypothetical protein V7S43_015770 [Phytophthora oleae]|uniref:Uncharacterized protein n=1 Tax=Phytophthora oleae TaxID=2107226 RepID=A0ABD3EXB1_9STRA
MQTSQTLGLGQAGARSLDGTDPASLLPVQEAWRGGQLPADARLLLFEAHYFLETKVGFDCVDDKSKAESFRAEHFKNLTNSRWTHSVRLLVLLPVRQHRCAERIPSLKGTEHLLFPPSPGDPEHLTVAYLTANGINHGITLRKFVALQYLCPDRNCHVAPDQQPLVPCVPPQTLACT